MHRKGFTLVELLVVIAILFILGALLFGAFFKGCAITGPNGENYYDTTNTGVFRCVKTYTHVSGGGETSTTTSKRIDLKPKQGGPVVTMECNDDWNADIRNSATLFAQFEAGNWYEVTYIGFRDEYWSYFPLVKSVRQVDAPPPELELE